MAKLPIPPWCICPRGSCQRNQACMYVPCCGNRGHELIAQADEALARGGAGKNISNIPDDELLARYSTNDAQDAARWRALLSSPRLRILGTAGFFEDSPGHADGYRHFGLEAWTMHDAVDNEHGAKILTEYADAMIAKGT